MLLSDCKHGDAPLGVAVTHLELALFILNAVLISSYIGKMLLETLVYVVAN